MNDDNALSRVRKIRNSISEKCGNDPENLVKYYQKKQKAYKNRIVSSQDLSVREEPPEYDT